MQRAEHFKTLEYVKNSGSDKLERLILFFMLKSNFRHPDKALQLFSEKTMEIK